MNLKEEVGLNLGYKLEINDGYMKGIFHEIFLEFQ